MRARTHAPERLLSSRGPRRVAAALLALAVSSGVPQAQARGEEPPSAGCAVCHGAEGKFAALDVHARAGLGCTDCHGGTAGTNDQTVAHRDLKPLKESRAALESCGSCHADTERMRGYGLSTDQLSLYWTSAHGQRLAETGDPNVATCVDCHGAHGIYAANDPRSSAHKLAQVETCGRCHADAALMDGYGLDHTVVDQFTSSVHGVALLQDDVLSSPSCSDCHGSHGARPPRVSELGRVCGNCHSVVERLFDESPHAAPAREGVIDECVACHDSHATPEPSSAMLAGQGHGNCATCHGSADDPGARAAAGLYATLTEVDQRLTQARERVRLAASRGLFLSEEHGYLADAEDLRARMRAMTHTLSQERLKDLMNRAEGMIEQTYQGVRTRERKLRDRKIFTGIFLGMTLFLAGVLHTYRRESFGSWRTSRTASTGPAPGSPDAPAEPGGDQSSERATDTEERR